MDMPKPGKEHKQMEQLAGRWTGKEIVHPGPWTPEKMEMQAFIENRVALAGFAVIQDYRQELEGQTTFQGHGVLAWDGHQGCHVMHWFDSFGMGREEFKGGFEGQTLTLVSDTPRGKTRATWEFPGGDHYSYKMEMSPDGKEWQLLMEGEYQRQP